MQLARLLAGRGDLDELRARANVGDWCRRAAGQPAGRAGRPGRAARPGRRRRRERRPAAGRAAGQAGDLDELRARADAGDGHAAGLLAGLLAERGDLDGAAQILRAAADAATGAATTSWLLAGRAREKKRSGSPVRLEPGRVNSLGVKERRGSSYQGARNSRANPMP